MATAPVGQKEWMRSRTRCGGSWVPPPQETRLLEDRVKPPSWCSLLYLTQWPEASELLHAELTGFPSWMLLIWNLFLPLFCLGLKRQPSCFWNIQPDSHQAVASSKNHENLPQGLDILYGTGKGHEVFSIPVPCPSEVTTPLSIQILAVYCQRRHKEYCCTVLQFQFLENNYC